MEQRAFGGICLGPMDNPQGSVHFLNSETEREVIRWQFTVLPTPQEVLKRVAEIARNDDTPPFLTFENFKDDPYKRDEYHPPEEEEEDSIYDPNDYETETDLTVSTEGEITGVESEDSSDETNEVNENESDTQENDSEDESEKTEEDAGSNEKDESNQDHIENNEEVENNDEIAGVPMQDFNMEPPEEEIIFESAQNDDADVVQNEEQEEEKEENEVVKTRYGRASNKTSWMVPTFKGKRYDHATFAVILTNIIEKNAREGKYVLDKDHPYYHAKHLMEQEKVQELAFK